MPPPAATTDPFTALGEPRRREILSLLARGPCPVMAIVEMMGIAQPSVSKHLGILRAVGLVSMARRGRERVYSVNGATLRAVHEWTRAFEHLWTHQIDRIRQRAEAGAASSRTEHHERKD